MHGAIGSPVGTQKPALLCLSDVRGYPIQPADREAATHRRGLQADLLSQVHRHLAVPFQDVRVESDNLLLFAPLEDVLDPQACLRACLEAALHFEQEVQDFVRANTCPCSACTHASRMRLRIIVHAGTVLIRRLDKGLEAVGSEVVLAHRLKEGDIQSESHLMLTQAACDALGTPAPRAFEPVTINLREMGDVQAWVKLVERQPLEHGDPGMWARFRLMARKAIWDLRSHGQGRGD